MCVRGGGGGGGGGDGWNGKENWKTPLPFKKNNGPLQKKLDISFMLYKATR